MGVTVKSEFVVSLIWVDSEIDQAKSHTARLAAAHRMRLASKGSKTILHSHQYGGVTTYPGNESTGHNSRTESTGRSSCVTHIADKRRRFVVYYRMR
jgi:hypothetical protein